MTAVWVVISRMDDGYFDEVRGVFSSWQLAQDCARRLGLTPPSGYPDGLWTGDSDPVSIEEHEIDSEMAGT